MGLPSSCSVHAGQIQILSPTSFTKEPTVSALTVLGVFLIADDGGIGGSDGGSIFVFSTGGVVSFSSSVDICRVSGDSGGEWVLVGKAGVGGIVKTRGGESREGEESGEYIGDDLTEPEGEGMLDGEGVRGGGKSADVDD